MISLAKEHGPRGLYRGFLPQVSKVALNGSLRFGTYGIFKRWTLGGRPEAEFTDLHALGCGAMCGAVSVPISHPIDVVKTNMMGLNAGRYGGVLGCVRVLVREEGAKALFKGMGMRMARVMSEQAVCFALFERVATLLDDTF